jgi:hypothetical protein
MTRWSIVLALALASTLALVLAVPSSDPVSAGSKRHHRARAPVAVGPHSWSAPARMIEVRPGLFISSYDCVTDEGYGRYLPCSGGAKR